MEEADSAENFDQFLKDIWCQLDMLELLDNTYFQKDWTSIIKEKCDEILKELDKKIVDHEKDKKLKSEYLYLRGKTLDYLPEY